MELFAGGGASWYWSKAGAGKSSLVLANWPCLDRIEMSLKLSTSSVLLVKIFRMELIQGDSLISHLAYVAADGKTWP